MINAYTLGGARERTLRAVQAIYAPAPSGGGLDGALFLGDAGTMFAAPDGAALAPVGGGVGMMLDQSWRGRNATQSTISSRPPRLSGAQTGKNFILPDGTKSLSCTFPNFGPNCTVVRGRMDNTVEITEGVSINGPFVVTEASRVLFFLAVFSGPLTAEQKRAVTQLAGFYRPGLDVEIANGTFESNYTGWTRYPASGALSIVSGRLRNTLGAADTNGRVHLACPTTVGGVYQIKLGYYAKTAGGQTQLAIANGDSLSISADTLLAPYITGPVSYGFVAANAISSINIYVGGAGGTYQDMDNLSLRRII